MAKLITCPDECGFCDRLPNYRDTICRHPQTSGLLCINPDKFPVDCPLDDTPTLNRTGLQKLLHKHLPNILADKLIDKIYGTDA